MSGISVSVVIPIYNSEGTIKTIVSELNRIYSQKYDLQIILVNDGSKDGSQKACSDLVIQFPNIIFIDLTRNFGQHNATMAGLQYAGGYYVLTMDDDLQHHPTEVQKLIDKIDEGYDMVYGEYLSKHHSFAKNIGSKLNNLMAWVMIRKPLRYSFTSFRIIRNHIVKEIIRYDAPYPYVDGLILRATDNIGTVSVKHMDRVGSKSSYTFLKMFGLWLNGFYNFSMLPLRLTILGGLAMAFFGFLYSGYQVHLKLTDSSMALGWASLITSIMTFAGVQLVALGVIGEYIGRIFLTQNKTPMYVARNVFKKRGMNRILKTDYYC